MYPGQGNRGTLSHRKGAQRGYNGNTIADLFIKPTKSYPEKVEGDQTHTSRGISNTLKKHVETPNRLVEDPERSEENRRNKEPKERQKEETSAKDCGVQALGRKLYKQCIAEL
jgi:hypothetical protein